MKKIFSIILATLLVATTLTGCTGQNNLPGQNGISNDSSHISMPDAGFSDEDYQKLLALQFDGYEDMTISDFQNRVWELTDTTEYRDLLERFSKSETLYELKDTDETATFLFYVLEPLTSEKWETKDYSGYTTTDFPYPADNATLEYDFTLTIMDADALTIRKYNTTRLNVISGLKDVLNGKTEEELQNETSMLINIQTATDSLIHKLQSDKIGISIEYAYFPLSLQNDSNGNKYIENATEQRKFSNGTEEDYRSLLALKTPDYQNMALADFNMALLAWANEDYDRMERIGEDMAWNDFQVNLTAEELSFVKLTVLLSGMENGKYVQSNYTGQEEENPVYDEYLPQRTIEENGNAAWCSLYYQFSYNISATQNVTVGERDSCIDEMISAVHKFWNDTDIEIMLQMDEGNIVTELQKIAKTHSTDDITISTGEEQIHFERMDERQYESPPVPPNASTAYEKLIAYKTENYSGQSVADFNAALASTPDELTEFLAAEADVISTISPDDENYDFFTTTMSFSSHELYCEHMGEEFTFSVPISKKSRPCNYLDEDGETVYDFICFVEADVAYSINAPKLVTVAERDKALLTFKEEMQNYLNGLSEAEIAGGNIKKMLIDKSSELANSLSTENMKLSPCEIYLLEINDAGTESTQ